jgi:hypothetical protein
VALIGGVAVLSGGLKTAYEASAQGAEAGVSVGQEAAGSDDSATAPEEPATPAEELEPTTAPTPTPTPTKETPTPTPTPTKETPSPSPTRPKGAIEVEAGDEAKPVDIDLSGSAKGFTVTVDPEWAGDAYLDKDDELVFEAARKVESGTLVTVSWVYSKGGKLYDGSLTYWIE